MSTQEILVAVQTGALSIADASKLLPSGGAAPFTIKVSEKGAIQMRGVPGASVKFGLTLYASAIEFLFANRERIEKFIADNSADISRK